MSSYYTVGYHTETFGTEIVEVVPARSGKIPVLRGFRHTAAGTEHFGYWLNPLGQTTAATALAAGGTSLELAKTDVGRDTGNEEEPLASGDWLVYQCEYGNWEARKLTGALSGNSAPIAATGHDIAAGAPVWAFYEPARSVHHRWRCPSGGTTSYEDLWAQAGIPHQDGIEISVNPTGAPGLFLVDNGGADGKLEYASFTWVDSTEYFSK